MDWYKRVRSTMYTRVDLLVMNWTRFVALVLIGFYCARG